MIHSSRADRGCIVDGISTGRNLAADLGSSGVACAHVRSAAHYPGVPAGTGPDGYDAYFDGVGRHDVLLAELRAWSPAFVVAGSEFGVALADRLSSGLGLPLGNNPATTDWRRNKFAMHQRLAECGLAHAAQFKTADATALIGWLTEYDTYPVVIKPLDSACSDGVSVCPDRQQALDAFDRIVGAVNRLGHVNREVLAQEYLDGCQYFVNTVSHAGRHYVSDVWRHDRRQGEHGRFLFENMVLQPRHGERETALCAYTLAVLDALGIENGAAHCEVMWTARGPVLIEANARLMGACIDPLTFRRALGHTQSEVLALACIDPIAFTRLAQTDYRLHTHLAEASFLFTRSGILTGFPRRADIERLPSFRSFVGVPALGTRITRTDNTLGEPGFAYFLHTDRDQVLADSEALLRWQREDTVFEIEESA